MFDACIMNDIVIRLLNDVPHVIYLLFTYIKIRSWLYTDHIINLMNRTPNNRPQGHLHMTFSGFPKYTVNKNTIVYCLKLKLLITIQMLPLKCILFYSDENQNTFKSSINLNLFSIKIHIKKLTIYHMIKIHIKIKQINVKLIHLSKSNKSHFLISLTYFCHSIFINRSTHMAEKGLKGGPLFDPISIYFFKSTNYGPLSIINIL